MYKKLSLILIVFALLMFTGIGHLSYATPYPEETQNVENKSQKPLLKIPEKKTTGLLNSTITAVTVFFDRAQVTRMAVLNLAPGDHFLTFEKLPIDILKNSFRVDGNGPAIIKELQIIETKYQEIPMAKIRKLFSQQEKLEDQKKELEDKMETAEEEKTLIQDIVDRHTFHPKSLKVDQQPDPDKWLKMANFYRTRMDSLKKELRDTNKSIARLKNKQDVIESKIKLMTRNREKNKYQAVVKVEMKKRGKLHLKLSYLITGVSWRPLYDLRVSKKEKKVAITYKAVVNQSTGEDWNKVAMTLSTAKPNLGDMHPEIEPLWLTETKRTVKGKPKSGDNQSYSLDGARASENTFYVDGVDTSTLFSDHSVSIDSMDSKQFFDHLSSMSGPPDSGIKTTKLERRHMAVAHGTTTSHFKLADIQTIKSHEADHLVTVTQLQFPLTYRYTIAPRLKLYAYLKAQAINDSQYPLLPGTCNVFMDNSYITESQMNFVPKGKDFWIRLGADESIKVEYERVKEYTRYKGGYKKTNKKNYHYIIDIQYNKKVPGEIIVFDRFPVSKDQRIKVKIKEPKLSRKMKDIHVTRSGVIKWLVKPQPGQQIKLNLKYTVEFPRDMNINLE